MSRRHIVILGAGVSGLAAAVRLATQGMRVTIVEQRDQAGGGLRRCVVAHPDRSGRPFRFDTGAGPLTLPLVFADLFAFAGRDVRDRLSLRRLDPVRRFVWRDGASLDLGATCEELLRQVARFAPGDPRGVETLLRRGRRVFDRAGEFPAERGLAAFVLRLRTGTLGTYARLVDRLIEHQRLRQALRHFIAPADPLVAPATLALLPHVELDQGVFHVEGGLFALVEALETLARELGVEIRTGSQVKRVLVENGVAHGVELADGARLLADAVVVEDPPRDAGAGTLLLGVEGAYPQLAHHTTCLDDDGACIEITAVTRTDPGAAPDGCESLVVRAAAGIEVISTLERDFGLTDLSKRIVVEQTLCDQDERSWVPARSGDTPGLFFTGETSRGRGDPSSLALAGKRASVRVMAQLG